MTRKVPPPHTGGRFPRDSLLEAVGAEPGLGVRELAKRTGHSGITVSKHLAAMRASGHIDAIQDGHRLRHYPKDQAKAVRPQLPEGAEEILSVVDGLPMTFPGLSQRFPEVPRSTLQYRVNRLVALGYLEKDDTARPAILNAIKWPA